MPDTAIAAGVVDLVLPAEEMGARLAEFARNFHQLEVTAADGERADTADESHQAIYRILRNQVGHDFSGYKEKTFLRRIRRRMQVLQISKLDKYIERLRENPDEVTLLFRDLLINVTSFFPDPAAFETLAELVIPRLFEGKDAGDSVRVWVPACATGEEVYSLTILLREHMDTLRVKPTVQLFATDIDEQALSVARAGRYPAALLKNVSPQRLKRFFTGNDVSFGVNKDLRDMSIFSTHSVSAIRRSPASI